jgi:lysozyme
MNWPAESAQLRIDEGKRPKPYLDTAGFTTIGIGRNLSDHGLSEDEIEYLFGNDLRTAYWECANQIPCFVALDDDRQGVLLNMMFNMGWPRLSKFVLFLQALEAGDWAMAADQMINSSWYGQVGARAVRLVTRMRGA